MSDLVAFGTLGFHHIVDLNAADHLLFLLALGAIYRPRDWRAALLVVSAFTVGHSITLAAAALGWVTPPTRWIEFLIPVTIVATGVENLLRREHAVAGRAARLRPVLALVFGLVHGAGFATYLRSLLGNAAVLPLLGFNLGVEVGQVVILLTSALIFSAADRVLARLPRARSDARVAFQWRLTGVSLAVTAVAMIWAGQRWP